MQAIKNALGSHSSHDEGTRGHPLGTHSSGTPGPAGVTGAARTGDSSTDFNSSDISPRTATSTASASGYDASQAAPRSSTGGYESSPTNASATRSTGLTESSTSSTSHTGAGRAGAGASHLDHSDGHDRSVASKFDPSGANVSHDHKHLQHVVHADHRHVEVEEVERQREVDRHVHHVQHHVQPVLDRQVKDEVHHTNAVPVTEIKEKHSSTEEDRGLFRGLASQHKDTETHRSKERTVVDLGEKVHENVHHHVHHVTQPVIEQEVVDRHRIHTVIPVHHTTHEAPIIHKSSTHEPVSMDSFLQGGGKLGSGITHDNAGVLNTGECVREVDGVGEKIARELHLGSSSGSNYGSSGRGYQSNDGDVHNSKLGAKADNITPNDNRGGYQSNDGDVHKSKIGAKIDDVTPSNNRIGSTDRV